jgi:hypothetical protein
MSTGKGTSVGRHIRAGNGRGVSSTPVVMTVAEFAQLAPNRKVRRAAKKLGITLVEPAETQHDALVRILRGGQAA